MNAMNHLRSRLNTLIGQHPPTLPNIHFSSSPFKRRRQGKRRRQQQQQQQPSLLPSSISVTSWNRPSPMFLGGFVTSLPFLSLATFWIYEYYYRVEIVQRAIQTSQSTTSSSLSSPLRNRDKSIVASISPPSSLSPNSWENLQTLLLISNTPPRIILLSGPDWKNPTSSRRRLPPLNDVSSFPSPSSSLLLAQTLFQDSSSTSSSYQDQAKIVHIPLSYSPISSSLSSISDTMTILRSFIHVFDLQWLQLRYNLIDALPLGGGSGMERDFILALEVITQALEKNDLERRRKMTTKQETTTTTTTTNHHLPVFIMDGDWFSPCLWSDKETQTHNGSTTSVQQTLLNWLIHISTERQLAHVILTGNDEWVLRRMMTEDNNTRNQSVQDKKVFHIMDWSKLIPFSDNELGPTIIRQEWKDVRIDEIESLMDIFGDWNLTELQEASHQVHKELENEIDEEEEEGVMVHNDPSMNMSTRRTQIVRNVLSTHLQKQIEQILTAFHNDPVWSRKDHTDTTSSHDFSSMPFDDDDQSFQRHLPLWNMIQRLVESTNDHNDKENITGGKTRITSIPLNDVRENILMAGDLKPLLKWIQLGLLRIHQGNYDESDNNDNHGIEIPPSSSSPSSSSWYVAPATPVLSRIFSYLIYDTSIPEEFKKIQYGIEQRANLLRLEREFHHLHLEEHDIDRRKSSLRETLELGTALVEKTMNDHREDDASQHLRKTYDSIVEDEMIIKDAYHQLRLQRAGILQELANITSRTDDNAPTTKDAPPSLQKKNSDSFALNRLLHTGLTEFFAQEKKRILKIQEENRILQIQEKKRILKEQEKEQKRILQEQEEQKRILEEQEKERILQMEEEERIRQATAAAANASTTNTDLTMLPSPTNTVEVPSSSPSLSSSATTSSSRFKVRRDGLTTSQVLQLLLQEQTSSDYGYDDKGAKRNLERAETLIRSTWESKQKKKDEEHFVPSSADSSSEWIEEFLMDATDKSRSSKKKTMTTTATTTKKQEETVTIPKQTSDDLSGLAPMGTHPEGQEDMD